MGCTLPHIAFVWNLCIGLFASRASIWLSLQKKVTKTRWNYPDKIGEQESERMRLTILSVQPNTGDRVRVHTHIRKMEKLSHFKVHLVWNNDEKNRTNEKEKVSLNPLFGTSGRADGIWEKKYIHTRTKFHQQWYNSMHVARPKNIVLRNWIAQKWIVIMVHI